MESSVPGHAVSRNMDMSTFVSLVSEFPVSEVLSASALTTLLWDRNELFSINVASVFAGSFELK